MLFEQALTTIYLLIHIYLTDNQLPATMWKSEISQKLSLPHSKAKKDL